MGAHKFLYSALLLLTLVAPTREQAPAPAPAPADEFGDTLIELDGATLAAAAAAGSGLVRMRGDHTLQLALAAASYGGGEDEEDGEQDAEGEAALEAVPGGGVRSAGGRAIRLEFSALAAIERIEVANLPAAPAPAVAELDALRADNEPVFSWPLSNGSSRLEADAVTAAGLPLYVLARTDSGASLTLAALAVRLLGPRPPPPSTTASTGGAGASASGAARPRMGATPARDDDNGALDNISGLVGGEDRALDLVAWLAPTLAVLCCCCCGALFFVRRGRRQKKAARRRERRAAQKSADTTDSGRAATAAAANASSAGSPAASPRPQYGAVASSKPAVEVSTYQPVSTASDGYQALNAPPPSTGDTYQPLGKADDGYQALSKSPPRDAESMMMNSASQGGTFASVQSGASFASFPGSSINSLPEGNFQMQQQQQQQQQQLQQQQQQQQQMQGAGHNQFGAAADPPRDALSRFY